MKSLALVICCFLIPLAIFAENTPRPASETLADFEHMDLFLGGQLKFLEYILSINFNTDYSKSADIESKYKQIFVQELSPSKIRSLMIASIDNKKADKRLAKLVTSLQSDLLKSIIDTETRFMKAGRSATASSYTELPKARASLIDDLFTTNRLTTIPKVITKVYVGLNKAIDDGELTIPNFNGKSDLEMSSNENDYESDPKYIIGAKAYLAEMYKTLGDADLKSFVSFLKSDDYLWFNQLFKDSLAFASDTAVKTVVLKVKDLK